MYYYLCCQLYTICKRSIIGPCASTVIWTFTSECSPFFFFNEPAPTGISTLSLPDALPIYHRPPRAADPGQAARARARSDRDRAWPRIQGQSAGMTPPWWARVRDELLRIRYRLLLVNGQDRKSTRLNSSHSQISYAVFCLKK